MAKPGDGLQSDGPLAAAAEFDQRLRALVYSLGGFVFDSPLEGDGFELLVPRHKSDGFPQHSGHCEGIGGRRVADRQAAGDQTLATRLRPLEL